jgi:hypothetical protein
MAASSKDWVCAEKQLLVCCSRSRVDPSVANEIRRLVALPLDWNFVLAEAASNSVTPLLSGNLSSVAPGAVPSAQFARLKDHVRGSSFRSLVLTGELILILEAFADAGIKAIPYKGPVLAMQTYGDVALREFEDIDLVLRQRDMPAANEVLVRLGFLPRFPTVFAPSDPSSLIPGEYDYVDPDRRLIVELHTESTLRHFPVAPDLNEISRRLDSVSVSSHEIRTFSPEDTLVFICVHGSKDFWERIGWVADIAAFVASHPQLDWDGVYAFADRVRARRMLHLGLTLADRLLGIALPDSIRSRVRDDGAACEIATQFSRRLLSHSAPALGARATFAYRRRMATGAVVGWRYAMELTTAPAAEDWQAFHLPRALAPLYAALRPFRLLRKYGATQQTAARQSS